MFLNYWSLILWLVIIINLMQVLFAKKADITYITPDIVRSVGDSVELQCTVLNPDSLSVLWSKTKKDDPTDQTVLSVNNVMLVTDNRHSISFENDTYTLKVCFKMQQQRNFIEMCSI